MELTEAAPWLALATATLALAVAAWGGWRTWTTYQRVKRTQRAAVALVDVHRARLDVALDLASRQRDGLADGGEELAAAIADLRGDADHLRWLLARVPEERARLRRELIDTLLPTGG